jgi:hypothetical protein
MPLAGILAGAFLHLGRPIVQRNSLGQIGAEKAPF